MPFIDGAWQFTLFEHRRVRMLLDQGELLRPVSPVGEATGAFVARDGRVALWAIQAHGVLLCTVPYTLYTLRATSAISSCTGGRRDSTPRATLTSVRMQETLPAPNSDRDRSGSKA